ncbi:IclR family transcriptional regulator [Pseudonocardia parietis]|uniref:DNA-binding IclR family transcriptional regulator n=1 Tax=Pseudonocardia parietis TaxID=570936 RepID=A0ABS4VSS1_9PSEU|nr:helix-turn-helix domain-containing protein [Pseudonocardia parietis]MBP2366977.1 DNA-binding IclR family transcriptional regulator [Pseudonocardia parietis]
MEEPVQRGAEGASSDIQAVTRASQILALFRPDRPQLTVAAAATELGLNRTTTHRYFASLVSSGLLERGRDGVSFVPGGLLVQLGTFALGRRAVVDLAPAHLAKLSRTTRLSSALSLWGSTGPVVTRVEEDGTSAVVVSVRVGHQLPVDTAQSQVFLAFMADRSRAERLLAGDTGLAERVEEVRRTGLSSTHIAESDITAVGAPVFDEAGICATIAVIGTARTLPVREPHEAGRALADAAYALSAELGGERHYPDGFPGCP